MDFVYVETDIAGKRKVDYSLASLRISKRSLISLIHGLKGKNFGFDTALKIASKIKKYKKRPGYEDIHIYVDSGGYSLIKGDVSYSGTAKFIDCYNRYLEHERSSFDSIFSLDIPFWGLDSDEKHRTKQNLYIHNKRSLEESLHLLKKYTAEDLASKFYFVWQFRFKSQFDTWTRIYDELQLNQHIKCRAIGGLVGIRDFASNIKYSIFTAMAFKCFADYLCSPFTELPFKLHVLGIYLQQDKAQLILLEKLFAYYCEIYHLPAPLLTHDTINYTLSALYNSRTLEPVDFNGSDLIQYRTIFDVDDNLIKQIYFTKELYDSFCEEREKLKANDKFEDSSFIVPLNVHKNVSIDRFLNYVMGKFDVSDIFLNSTGEIQARKRIKILINDMRKNLPSKFTETFFTQTKNNLEIIYPLWTKINTQLSLGIFDSDVEDAIRHINRDDPFV